MRKITVILSRQCKAMLIFQYDKNQSVSEFNAFIVEKKRKKSVPKIEPQA